MFFFVPGPLSQGAAAGQHLGAASAVPSLMPGAAAPQESVQKNPNLKIGTSIHVIQKVPKRYQVDGIQRIESDLDSTLTGKCDQDECAVIIWMLTRIDPNFTLSDLRVCYYDDLWDKYKLAAARLKDWGLPRLTVWLQFNLSLCIIPPLTPGPCAAINHAY